jgi:uncharacterized protein with FMN-binding domain
MDYRKDPWRTGVLALAVMAALSLASCKLPEIDIDAIDFATLADGSYEGGYKAEMGSATVRVAVSGGRVTGIELVAFDSSPLGEPAKAMTGRVVERQGLDADCVSGATYSSKVILKAIENALTAVGK